ncbi:MAG: Flp family type IVb pilin [Bdellovibrionales bacterium]
MKVKKFLKRLVKEESGQGATEYILLLVAVVAVLAIFKDRILAVVENDLLGQLESNIQGILQN